VLFGDIGGDYMAGESLGAGDYEMVLTAYSGEGGGGRALGSQSVSFSIAAEPSGREAAAGTLTLVDATNDVILFDLDRSVILDADSVDGIALSAAADPDDGGVDSVRFMVNGSQARIENADPFVLFGEKGGDYAGGLRLDAGDVAEIEAEFYGASNAAGDQLGKIASRIRVEDGTLSGTSSSPDTFAFDVTEMGAARVRGMEEIDSLALFGARRLNADAVLDRAEVVDGDTVLDFGGGNVLTIEAYRSLSSDDLIF
jgi:hypothetical protein